MPVRITNSTLILFRNGQRVKIRPNLKVDLTEIELADIKASNPDAIRTPSDETESIKAAVIPVAAKGSTNTSKPAASTAGGKAADNEL